MYMMNRPEFLFAHLGGWSIGSAPAWINYNLAGDALVHCFKVSGAKVLLVDEDQECRDRIEAVRERLESELGMTVLILDTGLKGEISRLEPTRPEDELRVGMKGKFPLFLFYTRSVRTMALVAGAMLIMTVAPLDTRKLAPSRRKEWSA
jgi:acyl-coenzyme A synthetase/AMP-(fatty) acid ligase